METIELAIEKTMVPLELSVAKEMVARYGATRKTLIDETYGINDTKSVWVSLDKLKEFINQLPESATGVRIYLAAYDHTEPVYPDQTTAIFIGTVEKGGRDTDAMESTALFDLGGLDPFNRARACPPYC